MSAGARDSLITFQGATTSQDEYGQEVSTWGDLGQEWAEVFYGRGDERRQAAMEQGSQAATFRVLSNSMTRALVIKNRIQWDGSDWDIEGIAKDTPKRGEIELTAVRAV